MGSKQESGAGGPERAHLPLSRVKTIMKSSPEVEAVGPEPLFVVARVTELFLGELARRALQEAGGDGRGPLLYRHVADVVQRDDTLDFLREIMPRKITVREYKLMMERRDRRDGDEDSSDDQSSDD